LLTLIVIHLRVRVTHLLLNYKLCWSGVYKHTLNQGYCEMPHAMKLSYEAKIKTQDYDLRA